MERNYDNNNLETSLSQMEVAALNFAHRFITDGRVRLSYIAQVHNLSQEYRQRVMSGRVTAEEAAGQVQTIRNEILEAQRIRSSDIGRAKAINLKRDGLTLNELANKYAKIRFRTNFDNLSISQKNSVYLEIVDSSGRPRPSVNVAARRWSTLGKGLLIVTIGVAVYSIMKAEDKITATAREGVILGGGFAGGAAGGAVAGLACGPGAPVCATIGVFLGGALGALGVDAAFGWRF